MEGAIGSIGEWKLTVKSIPNKIRDKFVIAWGDDKKIT